MQVLHQVKVAVLIAVNHHAVNNQLLLWSEKSQQAFQTGDMVHGQFQGFHQATVLFLKSMDVRWVHRVEATQRTVPCVPDRAAGLDTQESPRATPATAAAGDTGMDLARAQTRGPGQEKDHSQGKGRAAERPAPRKAAGATI